jgi:hypothetical protein
MMTNYLLVAYASINLLYRTFQTSCLLRFPFQIIYRVAQLLYKNHELNGCSDFKEVSTNCTERTIEVFLKICTDKGMVRSDMSKPALIFFSLQEYTQQNPLSKF